MAGIGRGILGLLVGYVAGASLGVLLVSAFSTNVHDKSVEVVMTAAFVTGPIMAIIGLIIGLCWRSRKPAASAQP